MKFTLLFLLVFAPQQSGVFFGSNRLQTGPAASGSSPTTCTTAGTIAYYDPDNIASCTGGTFSGLNDSSSTHANLVPVNGPTCVAAALNGHNVIQLDSSSSQYFTTSATIPSASGPVTFYAVFKPAATGTKMSFTSVHNAKSLLYAINSGGKQTIEYQQTAGLGTSTTSVTTSWFLGSGFWDGSAATAFYLNGTADGTGSGTISGALDGIDAIGANFSSGLPSEFLNGQLGLLVITSAAPDAAFQSCLVTRYGI